MILRFRVVYTLRHILEMSVFASAKTALLTREKFDTMLDNKILRNKHVVLQK